VCFSSSAVLDSDRYFPGEGVIVPKTKAAVRMTPEDRDLVARMPVLLNARELLVQRLGLVDYESALAIQKKTELAVKTGIQADTLLLLEHPHTLTIGRRGDSSSILLDTEELKARNVTLFETNRGGKVTYHGLGQVVGYPIINLSPDREDVHRYVRDLEEVLIRTMSDFGINAFRIEGLTGVHTERGKVAAIGVHIARWVTTHGFALNVNTDLSYFNLIIACEGEPVTSMEELLGSETELSLVEDRIAANFADVFYA
jgi:lipoyl(octanoyl) transferase